MVASFEKLYEANGVVGTFPRGFSPSTNFAWQLVRADALVSLNYGKALVEKNRIPGNVPVYGTNGQCGWHNTELAKGPGVILGRKGMGPLGVEWCESDFWVIDTAYYVSSKTPELNLKFFYYLIKYIGLNHLKDGTSNPSLSRDTFYAQLLPLPPLPEQKAIAHILGTLDDKIELNREMNKTLEAMARAIFKSWFVDFDPVRAKMEGRQPAGMDAATAELFPDEFEESALGMVPKGWKVIKLGDLIDIKHGYAFKGEFFRTEPPGDILLTPGNFAIGGGFKDDKFKYYLGEVPEEFVLDQGDLLVTMTDLSKAGDTLGYPAIIPAPRGSHYLHNQRLGKVIIKSGVSLSKLHLYYLLCTDAYRHEILASATGTTVKHTSPDRIKAFDFLFPNNDISLIFGKFLTPSYNKIILNQEESLSLASIRDTLLPKLLSGEIRVKEAEKIVETQL
ncbi:MAG: restriction endonuclease subunit S [Scytonema hyalinum WJT4-NPBG1]|nr:restriction endonuclease subunit S [Scytonema hyalinum WJT4-NPBG1]